MSYKVSVFLEPHNTHRLRELLRENDFSINSYNPYSQELLTKHQPEKERNNIIRLPDPDRCYGYLCIYNSSSSLPKAEVMQVLLSQPTNSGIKHWNIEYDA